MYVFICINVSLQVNIYLNTLSLSLQSHRSKIVKWKPMVILREIYLFRGYFQGPHLPAPVTGSLLLSHTLSITIFTNIQVILKFKR